MKKKLKGFERKKSSELEDQAGNNMKIKVLFLGVLADITQRGVRYYRNIKSFSDLRHRVEDEFPGISSCGFRIAVNYELINDSPQLNNGDVVTFLPLCTGD